MIKEFRNYLITYHQNVLEAGLRVPMSDTAKRFAERQYKEYKSLLEDGLSAIQRGEYYFLENEE